MLFRLNHPADGKRAQRGGGVFDALHLQPQIGQGVEDLIQRGLGFQVLFQPVQGEFHQSRPSVSKVARDVADIRLPGKGRIRAAVSRPSTVCAS